MDDDVALRPAREDEAEKLSELALRSKGYWGYSQSFLEACRAELTVADAELPFVTVAEVDGTVVGFVLLNGADGAGELRMLFVDPPWIGRSIGSLLMKRALHTARELDLDMVWLDADPGAAPFYAKHGAERIGEAPSGSIPGRLLPRMRFTLRS